MKGIPKRQTAMKTKNIKQNIIIKAAPREIYETLMDSKKHSEFTGGEAKINPKVGGKFTAYDGYAEGKNLELAPDKKIIQSWRASDWPEGHFSTVTFLLKKNGKGSTKLEFSQKEIPREFTKDISDGWKEYYWKPIKKMLEK